MEDHTYCIIGENNSLFHWNIRTYIIFVFMVVLHWEVFPTGKYQETLSFWHWWPSALLYQPIGQSSKFIYSKRLPQVSLTNKTTNEPVTEASDHNFIRKTKIILSSLTFWLIIGNIFISWKKKLNMLLSFFVVEWFGMVRRSP